MTKDLASLQEELRHWEDDLQALESEGSADGWSEPERLLTIVQKTLTAYRGRILPRIQAEHDLVLPSITDQAAPAVVAAYDAIVEDELVRLVDRLEDLRRELIRSGRTGELRIQVAETFAELRVLARVSLRFGQEVGVPVLTEGLTPEQSAGLTRAVNRYERSMR